MMLRLATVFIFFAVSALCACTQRKGASTSQCLGEWRMLDDPSGAKRIILRPEELAEFVGLEAKDVGIGREAALPATGSWRLMADGRVLRFTAVIDGTTHDHSGRVVGKLGQLELRFRLGDPDDSAWKRFQLVTPKR
jgi:hypothetical protein